MSTSSPAMKPAMTTQDACLTVNAVGSDEVELKSNLNIEIVTPTDYCQDELCSSTVQVSKL